MTDPWFSSWDGVYWQYHHAHRRNYAAKGRFWQQYRKSRIRDVLATKGHFGSKGKGREGKVYQPPKTLRAMLYMEHRSTSGLGDEVPSTHQSSGYQYYHLKNLKAMLYMERSFISGLSDEVPSTHLAGIQSKIERGTIWIQYGRRRKGKGREGKVY